MQPVFEAYRPLRNLIRSYRLDDTLGVVRAYSQYLAYSVPFPTDIEVLPQLKDPAAGIKQWELEIIAREAIAHAPQHLYTTKTLRRRNNLAALLNRIRGLEDQIASLTINQDNVLTELHRIGHRQFEWQSDMPSTKQILRYYKIFSRAALGAIVAEKVGLDTRTIYLIGLRFTGFYLKWFALNYPPTLLLESRNNITTQQLNVFLEHFSLGIDSLAQRIRDELRENMDENYAYFFDSLRAYPVVDMTVEYKRSLVAPLPALMTWRFTRGLYYELYDHRHFDHAFGAAFQAYVGEVLADLFAGTSHTVVPEEQTANDRGVASSDWFLVVGESALVIETKTKRLGLAAKISLNDTEKLDSELGKLADGILQTYKCIDAIRKGMLSDSDHAALRTKRVYPVIVTLESWHIFGPTWRKLNALVRQRLSDTGLPVEWSETMPFTTCDINEFEYLVQAIQASDSIDNILDERLNDAEFQQYELYTYLYGQRRSALERAQELFPGQFNTLFT